MSTASRLTKLAEGLDSNGVLSAAKGGTGATTLASVLSSVGGNATVSATAPASPSAGAFWLKDDTGDLHVYAGGSWVLIADGSGGGGGASTPSAVSDQANTSTGYFDLPAGTTAQRPASPTTGNLRYNTTTGFAEVYTGAGWGIFGAVPPSISSVSPVTFNGEQGTVFTINGADFTADASVNFIDSANNLWPAGTVVFVSSAQLTATTPKDFTVADEPLDVRVSQASGQVTKTDCIDCGGTPTWTTASGTIATINDAYGSYSPIATVAATDPDSGATISYSVTTGSLPAGTTLNASTGEISGDPTNIVSQTTSTFSVTAADNAGNTAVRSFSIIVNPTLDGASSARAGTSATAIKTLTSTTTNGKYWITINGTAREIYCDMANDGGGWMLYSSFANDNEFANATTYPAIKGNGILNTTLATNGYTASYTSYNDGAVDGTFSPYARLTGCYGFFYSSSPQGTMTLSTWNGPTTGITALRAKYGCGASSGSFGGPGAYISLNNGAVTLAESASVTGVTAFGNFNPAGATPLVNIVETGIAGIYWIMVR
jgi:hypothetical protein